MKRYVSLFQYRGASVAKCRGTNMAGHRRTVGKGPVSMLQRVRAVLAARGETTLPQMVLVLQFGVCN